LILEKFFSSYERGVLVKSLYDHTYTRTSFIRKSKIYCLK